MDYQEESKNPLLSVPQRKIDNAIRKALDRFPDSKGQSVADGVSDDCAIMIDAIHRYADANIPVDYWDLDMDNFQGDKAILKRYREIATDIDKAYDDGITLCLAGKHGVGKQLSLDTELPTPDGFTKLIDLKEGDYLFDEQGNICKVIKLHPIQKSPESYLIEFDDGSSAKACANHRWLTYTRTERRDRLNGQIRTTKEILETLRVGGGQNVANHSIPLSKPINYTPKHLEIDPYTLGCWLGDGNNRDGRIECAEQEILDEISKKYEVTLIKSSIRDHSASCQYRIGKMLYRPKPIGELTAMLKHANLICNKHIPAPYLLGTIDQRLSLLQGLMDTDGSIMKGGLCEFSSVNPLLAEGFVTLIKSLGIKTMGARKNKSFLNGKRYKDRYRVTFTTTLPVFRLSRKLHRIRTEKTQKTRTTHRFIINITPIKPEAMRCITVDSPSHLFLVTRDFIPTHNTLTTCCILKRAVEKGYLGFYTTLESIVSLMASPNSENKYNARQSLMMTDFLVIDEFDPRFMGSSNSSDLYGRILEPTLRHRIQNNLPLFLCTNSPKVTASFSGALNESISSLMNLVRTIPVLGADFRDSLKV